MGLALATSSSSRTRLLLVALFLVVILGAGPAPSPLGYHRDLPPRRAPARIVSLAPSVTEMVFALGAGSRLVGVTRFCDVPVEATRLPKVGGFADASLEAILGLKPDLVIAVRAEGNRKVADRLVDLGVPVLVVPGTTLADVFTALRMIGDALNVGDAAGKLRASIQAELDEVRRRVSGLPPTRVLLLYDHRPLIVAGPGSFGHELLTLAGGDNACVQGAVPYPTMNVEAVIACAPRMILDASMGGRDDDKGAQARALFSRYASIPAVRENKVLAIPGGALMRPGPRVGQDVRTLAMLMHPEAFATDGGR
ncbi:MAG: helical backbone metal receptor [Myxococcota bacterium]